MSDEKPSPVNLAIRTAEDWLFDANVRAEVKRIEEWLTEINLDPQNVEVVTHLGPGAGQETQALLGVFSQAQIHAIDYYDHIKDGVKQSPRVTFHQGLFVDVLQSGEVPKSGVVLMSDINIQHGFGSKNIGLLTSLVGDGFLMAWGDNGNIESKIWFQEKFERISDPQYPLSHEGIYRVRNN